MRYPPRLKIAASRLLLRPPIRRLTGRVLHLAGSPTLHDLYLAGAFLTTSSQAAVDMLLGESADYAQEYAELRERLAAAAGDLTGRYPTYYGVEEAAGYLLYALVRNARPQLMVEVGVADGRSTQIILGALDANGSGRLVSVDIAAGVGGAAVGHPRWELRIHSPERSVKQLEALIAEIGSPDVFFHDGSHTYWDQYAEYRVAWRSMRAGGVFVSDDIDHSFAFLDFVMDLGVNPVALVEARRVIGGFRYPVMGPEQGSDGRMAGLGARH